MTLTTFSPLVRDWFESAFEAPTPAQAQAWPAIATGEHVLISAPTGSGKTLAAFLWALDRLVADAEHVDAREYRTRLVYVSPLKALSYDVERNLRAPLRGLLASAGGADEREGRVAIRTRHTPPREILRGVEAVIVDEIHAVAGTKRGAHLALTLERLEELTRQSGAETELQRIGLSATQNPLEEVARFMVGPQRHATIVDVGATKPLDLRIHVPVDSIAQPDQHAAAPMPHPLAPPSRHHP